MMTSVPTNKPHNLAYLTTWFKSFKMKYRDFIKSPQDLWTMSKREVRGLNKTIWPKNTTKITIFDYAWQGDFEKVKELLLTGMDVNAKNGKKAHFSLLHIAAEKNYMELLDILEHFHPDPNIQNRLLATPIYYAVENKSFAFTERLLKMGADLNSTDKNGSTVFYWAVYTSNLKMLKYLHSKGAEMMIKNNISRSPLIKACFLNRPEIVEWLL